MNTYDKQHQKNLNAINSKVDALYKKLALKASLLGKRIKDVSPDHILNLDEQPQIRKQVNQLIQDYRDGLNTIVVNGVGSGFTLANNKNNELSRTVFGDKVGKLSKEQERRYISNSESAREAFLKRKQDGLSLSDRVWRYSTGFKFEIELGLDVGIRAGFSSSRMAGELKQWLKEPDRLYRRVRNERGQLQLSQKAKEYHPGQGVYRSSYQNARRLAVTETNMAYRTADAERWSKLDFVVGIEIVLSNNHTTKNSKGEKVELHDICDELAGRYPKDFVFRGWHPHCRCHAVPILKSKKEIAEDTQRILRGEKPNAPATSENYVKSTPANFDAWLNANGDRLAMAKHEPYFVNDNPRYFDMAEPVTPQESGLVDIEQSKPTALQIADKRHAERTPEQIKAIQQRAQEREARLKEYASLKEQSTNILNEAKEYGVDIDYGVLENTLKEVNNSAVYKLTDVAKLKAEMQNTIKAIEAQKQAEKALSDIIPDAHQWHKQFTMAELNQVHTAVESKLKQLSTLSEESKLKGLQREIKYVSDATYLKPHTLYPTWEVSKSAYSLEMQKTAEKWMLDSVRAGNVTNGSIASGYYASVILQNSDKRYPLQKSVLSAKEEKQAITNFKKYTKETPINPHTIWGGDIGGIWSNRQVQRDVMAAELKNVSAEELSLVTRYTYGMTFYNAYNLRNSSAYWKKRWSEKMRGLSAKEIADCERVIKEYTIALDGITNKMKRYDGYVFRGVWGDGAKELIDQFQKCWHSKDKVWKSVCASSSSTDISVANGFDNHGTNDLIMIIKNKTGVYIEPITHFAGEKEVLLLGKRTYRLLKEPSVVNGKWYVELEEL